MSRLRIRVLLLSANTEGAMSMNPRFLLSLLASSVMLIGAVLAGAQGQASADEEASGSPFELVQFPLGAPPPPGEFADDPGPEAVASTVFGTDDRLRVTDTTKSPFRSVTHLGMFDRYNNFLGQCSGSLVNHTVVLTAAHCVHSRSGGPAVYSIIVIPGGNHPLKPFGTGYATDYSLPQGWVNSGAMMYDFALVYISLSDFGTAAAPYLTVAAAPDSHFYDLDVVLTTAGYPGDKAFGTMWFTAGFEVFVDEWAIYTWMDAYPGQSGSAIWTFNAKKNELYAVGVFAREGPLANYAVRFTQNHIDALKSYCASRGCTLQTVTLPASSATPTPTPPPTVAANRAPLSPGVNFVAGPSQTILPGELLSCLPSTSWVGMYLWDAQLQEWRHFSNVKKGIPGYVNTPDAGGVDVVPAMAAVVLMMDEPVASPRIVEKPGAGCS
jgi:glutamyl endopeptidase